MALEAAHGLDAALAFSFLALQVSSDLRLIAPESGEIQAVNHLDKSSTCTVDQSLEDADPYDYDALVLPGGVANPDQLRTDECTIQFVQQIFAAGKPVGVICHGPWTLVEADLVRGRRLTSWPSLQTDIRNALAGNGSTRKSLSIRGSSQAASRMTCQRSRIGELVTVSLVVQGRSTITARTRRLGPIAREPSGTRRNFIDRPYEKAFGCLKTSS